MVVDFVGNEGDCLMMAPTQATSVGYSWWERVVVQRSVSGIETLVEAVFEDSSFLASDASSLDSLVVLRREELHTGELLGRGTYSNVYDVLSFAPPEESEEHESRISARMHLQETAIDSDGQTRYAIKHLKPELIKDSKGFESAASDLIVEAQILARLQHPNILKIHAVAMGEASAFRSGLYDSYFIVTDKLHETLNDRIKRWKACHTPTSDVMLEKLHIALQVGRALEYLHDPRRRLVYRDLKPHNVGLKSDGTVQLFDLGFCRELPTSISCEPRDTAPTAIDLDKEDEDSNTCDEDRLYCMSGKGTLMYMAPEVLGTRCFNQKADVYSWSMVVYELLSLKKPFPVGSIEQHRMTILVKQERPSFNNKQIPYPLQHLLQNCWDGDVTSRFKMADACDRLENILMEYQEGVLLKETSTQSCSQFSLWSNVQSIVAACLEDAQAGYQIITQCSPYQESEKELSTKIFSDLDRSASVFTDGGMSYACQQVTLEDCSKNVPIEQQEDAATTDQTLECNGEAKSAQHHLPKGHHHPIEVIAPAEVDPKPLSIASESHLLNEITTVRRSSNDFSPLMRNGAPFSGNGKLLYHKFYGPFGGHGRVHAAIGCLS